MLPAYAEWHCNKIKVPGDQFDENNKIKIEEVELWSRDILNVIKDLIGNPAFKDHLVYAPVHAFTDSSGRIRVYDEMWTGDWWWETQVSNISCMFFLNH